MTFFCLVADLIRVFLFYRFGNGFSHLLHNAHCLLPPNLACILKKDPSVANRISDMLEQYVTANFGKRVS